MEAGIDIGTENGSNYIAEMGIIVDVRKGTCDEDVAARGIWKGDSGLHNSSGSSSMR